MLRQPLLKRYLHEYFVSEIAQLPDALLFPLGQKVKRVLDLLALTKVIAEEQIVGGLIHGSPQNTYRVDYLVSSRNGPPPHRTNPERYDMGRSAFKVRFIKP